MAGHLPSQQWLEGGKMADLKYTQKIRVGNQVTNVEHDDRITGSGLHLFFLIMACLGGIALLAWILFGGFKWGQSSVSIPTTVVVPPAAPPPVVVITPPPPADPTAGMTPEQRRQYEIWVLRK